MLAPVTRQFKDHSTPESFSFTFYCDRCAKVWQSATYAFSAKGFELPMDARVRSMLWNQQHDEAYERANCEAGTWFNRCPHCGCRICDDCLYVGYESGGGFCGDCGDWHP